MLQSMRKHARYFYVLFIVVILSFIFWGVGRVDQDQRTFVAEVEKDRISVEEYWRTYDRVADVNREVYGGEFDEEKQEELKQQVLIRMVDDLILLYAADRAGVSVSDREVEDAITADPTFTRDGVFDSKIYERTLQLNRMNPEYFESVKRRELRLKKIRRIIEESVDLSPSELQAFKGDDEIVKKLREALLENKKKAAVRSYVDGMKKTMHIKVNRDLIP